MSDIIFELTEDEADGGYVATALGHAIATPIVLWWSGRRGKGASLHAEVRRSQVAAV
jgi:hypothetical protein